MQTISKEGSERLVFRVHSPLQIVVGGMGIFFLSWLIVHWFSHHPNHDRTIDLIVASITCLLFVLLSEKSKLVFDADTRRLSWTRRVGFFQRSGEIPFEEIEHVVVREAPDSESTAPSQRILLLTRNGEMPLTVSYSQSNMHAANAEILRLFLGRTQVEPLSACVNALVESGRDIDAIRELRLARGMSLTCAHDEVERIRRENSGGS
jgi:hypothetical protein